MGKTIDFAGPSSRLICLGDGKTYEWVNQADTTGFARVIQGKENGVKLL